MKRLYLLRHAQANHGGTSDKLRSLTTQGHSDAASMGAVMARQNYVPDYILCSPATRTKQTLQNLCSSDIICPRAEEPQDLYNASTSYILQAIQEIDDAHGSLLIVAHNPGIHYLAAKLTSADSPEELSIKLFSEYAPATLSVFDCPIENWADLKLERNALIDVVTP